MLCEAAPPSLQEAKVYRVPAPPAWGDPTAIVCVPCERVSVCGAISPAPPSTVNCDPGGLVWMVMCVSGRKFATTVSGAFMVTVVEALLAFATGPDQPAKESKPLGV